MSRMTIVRTFALAMASAWLASLPVGAHAKPQSNVPGGEPYQTFFWETIDPGSNGSNFFSPDPIPADRRLVIEFVSVRFIVPVGDTPMFALQASVGGGGLSYLIPLTFIGTASGRDEYRATMMVRLYSDGNGMNGPGADCSRALRDVGAASCSVTLSGYLIGK